MKDIVPFGERLPPDTITRLERAAQQRFETAEILHSKGRRLAALYMYGYCAEICLSTAYFRSTGFSPHKSIDRDTRQRRMAQARQMKMMNSDPHPLVGWARFLEQQRLRAGSPTAQAKQRLKEAVNKAVLIYRYWRPELRYKIIDISPECLQEVQRAAKWLIDNRKHL